MKPFDIRATRDKRNNPNVHSKGGVPFHFTPQQFGNSERDRADREKLATAEQAIGKRTSVTHRSKGERDK